VEQNHETVYPGNKDVVLIRGDERKIIEVKKGREGEVDAGALTIRY